jgi:RNA polymerase sigma-70 factor (ECF subfamily)
VGPVKGSGIVAAASGHGDDVLMTAIAGGDREALGRLYDRYAPTLVALAERLLGGAREAPDLVHDVFIEVWRQAGDWDAERGTVRSWILLRLRSRAADRRKAPATSRAVPLDSAGVVEPATTGDDPTFGPDRTKVRRALATLPAEQRVVLELGYFEGLSSTEIAARMSVPVGTVKSRVAAALAKLRSGLSGPREIA